MELLLPDTIIALGGGSPNLHSNMELLLLVDVFKNFTITAKFTFQYGATVTSLRIGTLEALNNLHSNMELLLLTTRV